MPTQGASITVAGGLDLVSSSHALFRTPGAATKLQNLVEVVQQYLQVFLLNQLKD